MTDLVDVDARVARWIDQVIDRHTRGLTPAEFLKAVRALSARYVERRAELPRRSPIDSAGKRAAFAAFFAPLHLLTVLEVIRALRAVLPETSIVRDLGCGTGAAGAAWALAQTTPPRLEGVDRDPWALGEAAWNWRAFGFAHRTRRGDLATTAIASSAAAGATEAIVLGWSVNELPAAVRARWLASLLARGGPALVVEPLARSAVPWWDEWADAAIARGGRADEWKFDAPLPAPLQRLDEAAGFRRDGLGARSLIFTSSRP